MKIKAKQRLHIGAAINHLKLAATSDNEIEFIASLRGAITSIEHAGADLAAEIKRALFVDNAAIAHAESLRVGGRFERNAPEAQPWAIEAGMTTEEIQSAILGEAPPLKPTGKK